MNFNSSRGLSRRRYMQSAGLALLAPFLPASDSAGAASASVNNSSAADWGRDAIASVMAKSGTAAVSVALWSAGQVVWQEAFGWANREDGIPANVQTRFNTGSVSKVLAALTAMMLQDRGLLKLDAPVVRYLPEFRMLSDRLELRNQPGPRTLTTESVWDPSIYSDGYKRITVRHLLSHSSGLPGTDIHNIFAFGPYTDYAANLEAALADTHLKHEPGELSVYCNDGFTMIERLVLALSGQSFPEFVRVNILEPLGMTNSGYTLAPFAEGTFAHPYYQGERLPQEFVSAYATGGLVSTPTDMLRLGRMFLGGGILDGQRIVSAAGVAEMGSDQTGMLRINLTPEFQVGLGWDNANQIALRSVGQKAWEKNGFTVFFSNEFYVLPESDIVLMLSGSSTNYDVARLAEEIVMRALLDRQLLRALPPKVSLVAPPSVDSPSPDPAIVGIYGNYNGPIDAALVDGRLNLRRWQDGAWTPMHEGLLLRSDGWWWGDTGDSFTFEVQRGMRYLVQRSPNATGYVRVSFPLGQQLPPLKAALSAAWKARIGTAWELADEAADSVALSRGRYLVKLGVLPDLPGYMLWDDAQLMRPVDDTRARMTVKVPINDGRDLAELVFQTVDGAEQIVRHGSIFRQVAMVAGNTDVAQSLETEGFD